MKALIINNKIARRFDEIPKRFDVEFPNVHGVDLLTSDELFKKRIIIAEIDEPVYDPEIQELILERYDKGLNKVVYDVVSRAGLPSLSELAGLKNQEFDNAKDEIINEMMLTILPKIIRLLKKDLPIQFHGLFDALEAEKTRVRNVIQGFVITNDYEGLRKFRVKQEDVAYFKNELIKFKE